MKDAIFYMKIFLENILGFGRIHGNKIFFCFFEVEINFNIFFLKSFEFFLKKFRKVSEETGYFKTGSVSYNISIQSDIKQNW